MYKLAKKLSIIIIIFVVMFSMVTATAYAVNTPTEKKYTGIVKIETKSKTVNYQITWNANGGKIGSKKTVTTTVKKGSKINKLAATPKRSGYTFKGFFTKKSGGTKISKNTKPTKSITYYAQWQKGSSSVLTAEEKKLVGVWVYHRTSFGYYQTSTCEFTANGKYIYLIAENNVKTGNYKVSGGKITLTNTVWIWGDDGNKENYPSKQVVEYKFDKEGYLQMP